MKAKPVKPSAKASPPKSAGKPAVKPPARTAAKTSPAKVVKTAVKAKAVLKPASKPTSQKPDRTPAKTASRPVVKGKVLAILPARKPVEAPEKAAPKSRPEGVQASKGKNAVMKSSAKVAAKALAKSPGKSSAKSSPKAPAKVVVKTAAQTAGNLSIKSAKAVIAEKPKDGKSLSPITKLASPAKALLPTAAPKPAALATNGLPTPPPLKPGRRNSPRALAHMPPPAPMVPTHAPDAAKASYSTMTERVIAPPPHVAAKKDPKLANNWKTKTAETLTEEEVKAMPDAEYMNDIQMAFFRYRLSILKQDIHNSAGATTEHLREDTTVVPDPADRATIEEEHALELRTRDRERKLLKKIEQSIGRIDSGDYGYCDETGEPIGVGRLIARPTASLSLEAQQRRELKQKMFGD